MYDPGILKSELPEGNTMAAEQTFVWLSRFLCAMPKVHHLFYLHRMVKHRNAYTTTCYKYGKKPLLPKAKACKQRSMRFLSAAIRHKLFKNVNI